MLSYKSANKRRHKDGLSEVGDATGTLAAYGNYATKGLGTFFGFRGSAITMTNGLPVDFAIAPADTDDPELLRCSLSVVGIRYSLAIKGIFLSNFSRNS